jgi:RimJ/RimL family protein N-acetyltransferase
MMIETERCLLRPFAKADINAFMAYRNDMRWMQYQGFKGKTREEYQAALLGARSPEEGVQLAIVGKTAGALIGDIYLKKEDGSYWIGYTLSPRHARQGYAFEVATAVIEALKTRGATCVKAGVEEGNTASIALLEKLQLKYTETCDGERIYVRRFEEAS